MRRKAAFTMGLGALVAAGGLATPSIGAAPAKTAPAKTAPAQQATVLIHPDVVHEGHALKQPPTTADCEAAFQVACYEPSQVQRAYNLPLLYNRGINGAGTTIVIVDSFGSPTIAADLNTFDQAFGLPAPPSLKVIQPAGTVPPFNPNDATMLGWAGETTLDVEWAHTVAPKANILLVETPVAETEGVTGFPQIVQAEEYVIDHHLGDVISQSFSATEQTFPSKASVQALRGAYIDAAAKGVTVLASTGDSGAANVGPDGSTYYLFPTVNWPPSDPLVTGVGGTQLHLDANGNRTSPDSAWNDTYNVATNQFIFGNNGPNPMSTGGGKSALFATPAYQFGVRNVVGGTRGVPDISMSAACDGAVDTYQSFAGQPTGWYPVCGTSEATPLFAGIVSLADQVAGHPLGLINPALYIMSAAHAPGLVDVTTGDNTVSFTQNGQLDTVSGYTAQAGYNLATGVGTLVAAKFVPELALLARS